MIKVGRPRLSSFLKCLFGGFILGMAGENRKKKLDNIYTISRTNNCDDINIKYYDNFKNIFNFNSPFYKTHHIAVHRRHATRLSETASVAPACTITRASERQNSSLVR